VTLHPIEVPVVTLDALIAQHGEPAFVKIDVEGYEPQVLRGLTRPVQALSFEFHGRLLDELAESLDLLRGYRLRVSVGNSFAWADGWEGPDATMRLARELAANDPKLFGDVHARSES
jgi:hypothetical protein